MTKATLFALTALVALQACNPAYVVERRLEARLYGPSRHELKAGRGQVAPLFSVFGVDGRFTQCHRLGPSQVACQ